MRLIFRGWILLLKAVRWQQQPGKFFRCVHEAWQPKEMSIALLFTVTAALLIRRIQFRLRTCYFAITLPLLLNTHTGAHTNTHFYEKHLHSVLALQAYHVRAALTSWSLFWLGAVVWTYQSFFIFLRSYLSSAALWMMPPLTHKQLSVIGKIQLHFADSEGSVVLSLVERHTSARTAT